MDDHEQLKGFSFFYSYYEAGRELPDKDRLKFYDAIIKFAFDGEEPDVTGLAKAMFALVKPNIGKSIARANAGANGGKAKGKQTESKTEANVKQTRSDKDKDIGKGLRIQDKEMDKELPPPTPASGGTADPAASGGEAAAHKSDPVPYIKILELFNATCARLPKITVIDGQRKKAVSARFKSFGWEGFKTLFDKAANSEFLNGNGAKNWNADFDWLMSADHFVKVIEGKYDNKAVPSPQPSAHSQYQQGGYRSPPADPSRPSKNQFINAAIKSGGEGK